jgi:hypothetical protein
MNGYASNTPFDPSALDSAQSTTEFVSSLLPPRDASLSTLETAFSALTSQLELAGSDLSSHVSSLVVSVSHSVPRLAFELQLMRERATLLRFTLDSVRKRSTASGGDESTDKVMERLAALSTIQRRLTETLDVLREAESWSTLDSEITALLSTGSFAKAGNRLAEASRSLSVFSNTPEFEARKALLVSLQNSLEANLVGRLVRSVGERDVKEVKAVGDILRGIGREEEFRGYYFGARRGEIVQKWKVAPLSDCARTAEESVAVATTPLDFASWLPRWNAELLSLLSEEATYIPSIFPSPLDSLGQFLSTTLDSLTPSLPRRLTDIAGFHGAKVLPQLIKLYHATEEFALAVDRILSNVRKELEPTPTSSDPLSPAPSSASTSGASSFNLSAAAPSSSAATSPSTSRTARRTSKRLSVSRRLSIRGSSSFASPNPFVDSARSASLQAWETSLFEPFLDWQAEYAELESRYLETYSHALRVLPSTASADGSRELWEACSVHFSMSEEALGRCIALTHGYGAVGFVEAVDSVFSRFLSNARETLIDARAHKSGGDGHNKSAAAAAAAAEGDEVDLEGLDYSSDDWATFQLGLKMLQACRSLSERLWAFEGKVRSRLAPIVHSIRAASDDPGYVTPGTTRGALTLLRQSTLNSAELSAFLDSLSTTDQQRTPSANNHHYHPHHPYPMGSLLFPRVRAATSDLATSCQLMLHGTILGPLISTLRAYPSLPVWTSPGGPARSDNARGGGVGGVAAFDLTMPTFSLSPTETVSRVGEGLFNLPRLFEVYADDDALAFSLETLPFVDEHAVKAQVAGAPVDQYPADQQQASSSSTRPPHRRLSLIGGDPVTPPADAASAVPAAEAPPLSSSASPLSSEVVISTWLSSLTLAVLSHLTSTVLPSIRSLSPYGATQLACDLEHVSNVAKAFEVESDEVERWREAVEVSDEDGKKRLSSLLLSQGGGGGERDEIGDRVARIRGWR